MNNSKIKSQEEIVGVVKNLKRKRKTVVTYNGSFNLLHLGHIKSLKEAKAQGDILIVLLNSDKSIKSYKGPNRPIVPQTERAQVLAALDCVDYVTIFDEINPKKILEKIKPNIHCNGADWGKDCVEKEIVEKYGGRIYILKFVPGYSTTQLINKILGAYSKSSVKAVFLDRDGTININEPEYIHKKEDFKFLPGVLAALKRLSKTDYKIIIVTNQSGVGRGYFTENDLQKLHQWLMGQFKKEKIRIDKIYYCPHGPKDNCLCRKPNIGMIEKAVKDFGIDLSKSWIIGDDERDMMMGREANLKTILLGEKAKNTNSYYQVKNLPEAVKIILKNK